MQVKLAETETELSQILKLQMDNYVLHVAEALKLSDGFVTVRHDLDLLRRMNQRAQQIIAIDKGEVVAYALVMLREFKDQIPVLVPMFDTFQKIEYLNKNLDTYNYYVMGQICVKDSHRGKGIFKSPYHMHREVYSRQFELCLTEVSTSNPRSMRAHESVGFKTIYSFQDHTDQWFIIGWNWK